jgi:uncharacterized protein YgfB (UPF0149 family)
MNQLSALPTYVDVTQALQTMESDLSGAEAHGLLCGIICATAGKMDTSWEKLMGSSEDQQSIQLIKQLHAISFQHMTTFSFDFMLLLPDDEVDINERTEALSFWCQGFLTGLQQTTLPANAPAEATEALEDITEIAQVNYGDIAATDEDENAYVELIEYVRLAVLLLYQEFHTETDIDSVRDKNLLH